MDTATRLLELVRLLQQQPVWSALALADRLEVTTRTVRRDVQRLRMLDYPIESVPGPAGGYRLGRGREVPPLVLEDEEALAVALGLRLATAAAVDGLEDAATSALAKIEHVLPERLRDHLRDIQDATVSYAPAPTIPSPPEHLLALAQGCGRQRRVRFLYTARDGAQSLRLVDPVRLVHAARRWYFVGFDVDRDAWRTFRVDRIRSVLVTDTASQARDGPDAVELVRTALSAVSYERQATVLLDMPVEEAAARIPVTLGLVEPTEDGRARLRIGAWDPSWLVGYLAGMPCRVEVQDPPDLHDAFVAHVNRLVAPTDRARSARR